MSGARGDGKGDILVVHLTRTTTNLQIHATKDEKSRTDTCMESPDEPYTSKGREQGSERHIVESQVLGVDMRWWPSTGAMQSRDIHRELAFMEPQAALQGGVRLERHA